MGSLTQPLTGTRVLDFALYLPGDFCTMMLGDMGAEVIKIEKPGGNDIRRMNKGIFFASNRNKQSVTLNLKTEAGREVCRSLIKSADVLVEGFRPGVMDRLGLGYDAVKAINPGLVYCAISGYGQDGPYSQLPGHDVNYMAVSGALNFSADMETPPVRSGIPIGDLSASMYAAVSILAALRQRDQVGKGQYIDIGITDCLFAWASIRMGDYLQDGTVVPPEEMSHLSPTNQLFDTGDGGRIAIGALEDKFWQNVCRAVGKDEWADRPDLATVEQRTKNGRAILPELKAIFRQRSAEEWVQVFAGTDVPCSRVLGQKELFQDPHIKHRRQVKVVGGATGQAVQVGYPAKFEDELACVNSLPPAAGEHNHSVLGGLGYSPAEMQQFSEDGVL